MTPYVGTIGNIGIHSKEGKYHLGSNVGKIEILNPSNANLIIEEYIHFYLQSCFGYDELTKHKKATAQESISIEAIRDVYVAVPPQKEQIRIVEKIEQVLMSVQKYDTVQRKLNVLNANIFANLKKSFLQEAIKGKLVAQDPNDEPTSVLLKRISIEKEKLVSEGKLKKGVVIQPSIFKGDDNKYYEKKGSKVVCIEDEIPFEIPNTWAWVRLDVICEYIQRGKSPKYSTTKKYPVIAQKCNQWSGFSIEKAQFIDPDTLPSYGKERFVQDRDLLWNSTGLGTLGRMAIYYSKLNPYELAVADSHVTVIRPFKDYVVPEYLYAYFTSHTVQSVIEDKSDGSTKQKELSTNTIKTYLVPFPPLEEQKHIVKRIGEVLVHL